jgi:superfamily I DNA and/or RNA helicase
MEFPNREFYDGKLLSGIGNITLKDLGFEGKSEITLSENVLVFIDTSNRNDRFEKQKKDSNSYYNRLEAEIVRKVVEEFFEVGLRKELIGIISPYDDQVDLIKTFDLEVDVKTIDGFQGREKEVIIISFVRSNIKKELGFLKDLRRLNVSLTRSKRKLICIGDSKTLENHETYNRFIKHVREKGKFINFVE